MTDENSEPTDRADEEFDRHMRARLCLDGKDDPPTIHGPGPDRPYRAVTATVPPPPQWDADPAARPAEYEAAHERLTAAAKSANELAERMQALPGEQAQAAAAFAAEAVAADREGRSPRFGKARDFARERAVLEAQHRGRRTAYEAARREYDAALLQTQPAWLEALIERREAVRQAAVEALDTLPLRDAVKATSAWTRLVSGTAALWQQVNPKKSAPPFPQLRVLSDLAASARAAAELLQSDDESVTGAWMQSTLEPPLHVRQQMADSGGGARMALMEQELAEEFKITQHTQPDALAYGLWGKYTYTPSGQRFLVA